MTKNSKNSKKIIAKIQGYIISKKTNRRLKIGSVAYKKYRKEFYIKNPDTGRVVLKEGASYKKYLRNREPIIEPIVEPVVIQDYEALEIKSLQRDFKNGDIDAFSKLVKLGHIFTDIDIINLRNIVKNHKYIMRVTLNDGSKSIITVSKRAMPDIKSLLQNQYVEEHVANYGSDIIEDYKLTGIESIVLEKATLPIMGKLFKKDGNFFKYINTSNIDLIEYQIIQNEKQISVNEEHCLIYALRKYGIDESILNKIKLEFPCGSSFSKTHLKQVSKTINKQILLTTVRNTKKGGKLTVTEKYGVKNSDDVIKLGLYLEHYFINNITEYTAYSSKHYNEIKDIKNFNNVIRMKKTIYEKSSNPKFKIDSFHLIYNLDKYSKVFKEDPMLYRLNDYVKVKNDPFNLPLGNIENEQRLVSNKLKIKRNKSVFFADIESFVTGETHEGFMMGVMKETDTNPKIFTRSETYNNSWYYNAFEYIVNNSEADTDITVYFHNLKYDLSVLKPCIYLTQLCEKDGMIYNGQILFNNRKITLVDSYKMCPFALNKFNKAFSLSEDLNKKEGIGYTYYTAENYNNICSLNTYIKHVKTSDHKNFYSNIDFFNKCLIHNKETLLKIEKLKKIKSSVKILKKIDELKKTMRNEDIDYDDINKTFSPLKYYKYYLKYDVLVLQKGLLQMKKSLKIITNLDMYDFLTISSITNQYFKNEGAFDSMYEVTGNLQEYISQAVTGGRVLVNEKYKKKVINKEIEDYDACSLYPSAIFRICKERGLSIGKAQRIPTDKLKLDMVQKYDYSILTINILKINKKQQMPFIHDKISKVGSIKYINEVQKEGMKTIIDIYQLEDYIKFHHIEYDILDGVYWNEGYNKTMGNICEKLYNDRLKYKEDKNDCLQGVLKLMLNSAYGKTITKKSLIKKQIVSNKDKDQYIYNYFNNIVKCVEISSKQWAITKDHYDDSYNLVHVGTSVLSYSKRIMNEVMNICNDNNINCYYQDTDSMHIDRKDIKKLEDIYTIDYNKNLKGQNMEQFHGDFDLKGADKDIYSTCSIFLGKKSYYDSLRGVNKETGDIVYGSHVRLKGITETGRDVYAEKFGGFKKLFESLANGDEHTILLNPKDKCLFEFTNRGVLTKKEFSRKVQF